MSRDPRAKPAGARRSGRGGPPLLPVAALAAIAGLDVVLGAFASLPLPVRGVLDEAGHLLTAWLFLAAIPGVRNRLSRPWTLLGAVAIDVDHVPLYLWGMLAAAPGGRPVSHSLLAVAVLAAAALVPPLRTAAAGLSAGVSLHLLRDIATGPGVPLAWPLGPDTVVLPYGLYLGIVAGLAGLAVVGTARAARAATVGRPTQDARHPGGPPAADRPR